VRPDGALIATREFRRAIQCSGTILSRGNREPVGFERETSGMGRSFDAVFAAEFASLHGFIARRLGRSIADDLTAETFAIAYRRWGDLDPSRPVRPWLFGIASNLIRHQWRKERRMLRAYARTGADPVLVEEDSTLDRLDAQAERAALAAALAELRREEREVLLLHAWAGLSDAEIAESLSLPVGTAKSRLSRAREHLRNRLGPIGQVEVETLKTAEEQR
jgi:RNA polymerase sigma-70 factor (ECF subfamily)